LPTMRHRGGLPVGLGWRVRHETPWEIRGSRRAAGRRVRRRG